MLAAERLTLAAVFVLTLLVAARLLYNHLFIRTYLPRDKLKINQQIADLNRRHGTDLPLITQESRTRLQPLPAHYNIKDKVVMVVFAVLVALAVELIVLMMCELRGVFNEDTRGAMFELTIDRLVFMLLLVNPLLLILLLVNQDVYPKTIARGMATVVGFGAWMFFLHKCGDLTQLFSPRNVANWDKRLFIEKQINEISIAGITTLAVLLGVGIALTPYRLWCDRYARRPEVTATQLSHQVLAYNQTTSLLGRREQELAGVLATATSPTRGGLLSRVQLFASLLGFNSEEKELALEIKLLRNVQMSLALELQAKLHQFSETRPNRVVIVYLYAFAAYCVYRLVSVLLIQVPRQWWSPNAESEVRDALAVTVAKVATLVRPRIDEDALISQISFFLLGLLFLCLFSNVVRTFTSFSKYFPVLPALDSVKNWFKHLAIAELVGIYVMATSILIRTYLPRNMSHQISQILSLSGKANTLAQVAMEEVRFIDHWFDVVFAVSAVVTMVGIWVRRNIADDIYDEEMLIETAKTM